MISRKKGNWFDIALVNLDSAARAKSTEHLSASAGHGIDIGKGREYIWFRTAWEGGPRGCVRTDADMDAEAEGFARALPVQCWLGEPDEVRRVIGIPHAFDSFVYIEK